MHEKQVAKGCYVIREGELGSHIYVSAEGEYEVIKDGKVLGRLGVGKAFGELAILYNCKRTASIKVMMFLIHFKWILKTFLYILINFRQ